MKIIKPWVEIKKFDGIQIMKNLELDAKQCYRSQDNITDTSYKNFLRNCINRGHESVLEHEKVTLRMCCDIGVYKEATRHRFASFSIESTRYCAYNKDKFGGEITYIEPCNIDKESTEYQLWLDIMQKIEDTYLTMANEGCTADQLRMILPHSTAAELCMTANIREWRHILSLRCEKYAHPSIQQIMIPILRYFQKEMPELFDKIQYNEEFNSKDYAEIKIID